MSGCCPAAVAGKPGSKVRSINTFRLRPACTPAETQLKSYDSLERSKLFPDSSAPQGIRLRDVTYKVSWLWPAPHGALAHLLLCA